MTRLLAASGLLVASLLVTLSARQDRRLVFEAVVERANGSFVDGLTAEDFVVTSDGTELPITECAIDDGPVSVVVMFDLSLSSQWPGLDENQRIEQPVAENLLAQFRGHDRLRMAVFGRRVAMSEGFTTRTEWIDRVSVDRVGARKSLVQLLALAAEERSGPSPIWDALDDAISALEPEPGRRAVILITDGKATSNKKDLADVAGRAVTLGIPVSTVAVGGTFLAFQGSNQIAVISPELALQRLSVATGGLAVVMTNGITLPSPLTTVVLALRQAYRISVSMDPGRGQPAGVTIRMRDVRYQVRSSVLMARHRSSASSGAVPTFEKSWAQGARGEASWVFASNPLHAWIVNAWSHPTAERYGVALQPHAAAR